MEKPKRKKFFRTKMEVILFCLLLIILSTLFLMYNIPMNEIDLAQLSYTALISVLCSLIAALLLPKIAQEEDYRNLSDDIVNRIEKTLEKNQYIIPAAFYEGTDKPHPKFNEKLNESIRTSKEYLYFSDRALYLSERLENEIHDPQPKLKITIFLADIRESGVFEARKEIYLQRERTLQRENPPKEAKTEEEIINDEKLKVLQSLYDLGRLKNKYGLKIYLHKEIPFIRFEITDELLVLSFLTQLSTSQRFPPTVLYENDNIFKSNFECYAKEVIERSYPVEEKDLELKNLLKWGKQANIVGCNEEMITKHYREKVKVKEAKNV